MPSTFSLLYNKRYVSFILRNWQSRDYDWNEPREKNTIFWKMQFTMQWHHFIILLNCKKNIPFSYPKIKILLISLRPKNNSFIFMGHSIIAIVIESSNLYIRFCWRGEHVEKSIEKIFPVYCSIRGTNGICNKSV